MALNSHIALLLCGFVVLMMLAPLSPEVRAGEPHTCITDSVHALGEVVVRAIRPITTPEQTIRREQIEALPSSSVADALKYMAGVQIKDYGGLGGQKTVNVRSLGAQHVGVYIDGVRVTNAQNGTVDLGKYSLTTLESVSLFNANKSEPLMTASEYASASTVYLQTHRPEKTSFSAVLTAGSFGSYRGAATWNFANSRGLSGLVDAAYTTTRGNYPFRYHTEYEDTTGVRRNSDIRMLRIENAMFWRGLQWHIYYFDSERGLPGGIVRRLSDKYTDVGREWDRNFFAQLSYKKYFGGWGVRAIAKYTNDWLHYRSDYPENIAVHANNRYHQQDIYAAGAGTYTLPISARLGELGFSASTDLRWSDLTCNVRNFAYVYRIDSKTSLAAIYKLRGLQAGLGALYTDITDHTRGRAKPLRRLTYNAQASYSFGPLALRTFYKTVFRAPTLNDLYYTLVGNRNLRPEYTRQLDLGLTYNNTLANGLWLDLQADVYYNRVDDRIVCLPLKGSYQWTMLNYGHTRCLGVNATLNMRYRQHSLLLSGTFQDDRNRTDPTDPDSYNDLIAYSPRWSLTAVYTFLYKGFSASLSHMFVDKRYWTTENALEPPLKAYNCTDVKVGYTWRWLTGELECQNLLNDHYEIIQRWPMPGRRFAFTLKFTI